MALIADRITYAYAKGTSFSQDALDAVSLSVEVGELVLVVGSTGSGKSTLLRMLAGLLAADSGTVTIDDKPLTSTIARHSVGIVFQDAESQLFAETVLKDVEFGPTNLGMSADEVRRVALGALSEVGLDAETYASRSPFGLSGGEARRAAIAGVLAMRPRFLLMDEPTAGLDARGRAAVRNAVYAVRDRAGVVVVSHTVEEFLAEADRVVILSAGNVSFSGSAAELMAEPSLLVTHGLMMPDVLRVQHEVRASGADLPTFTLDPTAAAHRLAEVRGIRA